MDLAYKKGVIEHYIRAYNDMNIAGMVAWMHPECSFENRSGGQVTASTQGVAQLRELAEKTKAFFSTRCQKMTAFHEAEEDVIVDITFEGVLNTNLPGGSRAGETIQIKGKSVLRFRDGLIYRITDIS